MTSPAACPFLGLRITYIPHGLQFYSFLHLSCSSSSSPFPFSTYANLPFPKKPVTFLRLGYALVSATHSSKPLTLCQLFLPFLAHVQDEMAEERELQPC